MGGGMSEVPEIPGYRLIKLLGRGGMGEVYLAEQTSLGREIALKIMRPHDQDSADTIGRRFMREAKAAASLRHPNIINVQDFGEAQGRLFMVMDYVKGASLDRIIPGGLTHPQVNRVMLDLCAALEAAHEAGFVHRDIKPANVLIDKKGRTVLTDFGIVKLLNNAATRITRTGLTIGSWVYMSPEQCLAKRVDHRSDLYSLGVMLFQILEKKVPFRGRTPFELGNLHLNSPPPPLAEKNAPYQPLVLKLMAKKSADRCQDAREVLTEIRKIAKS
jgi:serine/threonine protein kinase